MSNEIDDMFSQTPTPPVGETVPNPSQQQRPPKFSIFDEEPTPTEYPFEQMKNAEKKFTVAGFNVPYSELDKVGALFKALNDRGYTLASSGDMKDKLSVEADTHMQTIEYYLPFKKFNNSVAATVEYPYKLAYDYSSQYAYKYENLSTAIKSFQARTVHLLTGLFCDTKVNFMVIYTECGKETFDKIDWKLTGPSISTMLQHATLLNIPVFNLKNADAIERIKNHIG